MAAPVDRRGHRPIPANYQVEGLQHALRAFVEGCRATVDAVDDQLAALGFAGLQAARLGSGLDEVGLGVRELRALRLAADRAAQASRA